MIKYGMMPLWDVVERAREKREKAREMGIRWGMKKAMGWLKQAIASLKQERLDHEASLDLKAVTFYS